MPEAEEKSAASFGGIVATLGAILIALGVAWLIALNWTAMPAALKIIILVVCTLLAYGAGIVLRIYSYERIARALLILGALLYTLSIFLIAQIFSTSASQQGVAWLWVLAIAGVVLSGWLLTVPSLFIIALVEGVAWLWNQAYAFFSSAQEASYLLVLLFVAVGIVALVGSTRALSKNRDGIMLLLASLVSLAGTWLLLFFSLISSLQGIAWVLLIVVSAYIVFAYLGGSQSALVTGFVMLLTWIFMQYSALIGDVETNLAGGVLALSYLFIAVMMYGLTQLHKATNHAFTPVYRSWTALYILLLTYIMSFQTLLPYFWPATFTFSFSIFFFLLILGLVALIAAVVGSMLAVNARKLSGKEIIGFIALVFLYVVLISAASIIPDTNTPFDFENQPLSPQLFTMWIIDNILFIFVILAVIGYGARYQSPDIVNLAILFFVIDIITRYIGFIMDYGGQLGAAVMSIIGGIILIAGGWGIERWRRRLIERAKQKTEEYAIY